MTNANHSSQEQNTEFSSVSFDTGRLLELSQKEHVEMLSYSSIGKFFLFKDVQSFEHISFLFGLIEYMLITFKNGSKMRIFDKHYRNSLYERPGSTFNKIASSQIHMLNLQNGMCIKIKSNKKQCMLDARTITSIDMKHDGSFPISLFLQIDTVVDGCRVSEIIKADNETITELYEGILPIVDLARHVAPLLP